jgi:GTPase SAR1 family protein
VFDVTDPNSFKNVDAWLEDVRQYARKGVNIMIVGNKIDLQEVRKVDFKTAKEVADACGLQYMETSAKSGVRVEQAFNAVAQAALQRKISDKDRIAGASPTTSGSGSSGVELRQSGDSATQSSGCC